MTPDPKELRKVLLEKTAELVTDNEVAVLLSGGVDSLSMAFCAQELGKCVHAYSFMLVLQDSYDYERARQAAERMGWEFSGVQITPENLKADFKELATTFGCEKKTHFECCYPFLHLYPHIDERQVLSGWAADGYFGVSKKAHLHFKRPKEKFDEFRLDYFHPQHRAGFIWHNRIARAYGKQFIAPYLSASVAQYFFRYDWDELNTPEQKAPVRAAFADELAVIGGAKKHINLQLGAGVDKLFETLLDDPEINFNRRNRVMDMCRDWATRQATLENVA